MCTPSSAAMPDALEPIICKVEWHPAETPNSMSLVIKLPLWISIVPEPLWFGPPPPDVKILAATPCPDLNTTRPFEPLYLPMSKPPLTVNDGPFRIRDAKLLPPSSAAMPDALEPIICTVEWHPADT